ncbi:MAG: DUF4342 domain-containing protein [Peptococcaceae bacterium]|nr:DUF4342 domain-containing protein [Peptococcaceae bacterium]
MSELEKMDALRERLDVTYAQAKEALDACNGDLAQALIYLEEQGAEEAPAAEPAEEVQESPQDSQWDKETTENFVRGVIEQIKGIIQEGNVTQIRLKQGQRIIVEIPATLGIVGIGLVLFSPLLLAFSAIGLAGAMIKEMTLEIQKADGTVESRSLKFSGFMKKEQEENGDTDKAADEHREDEGSHRE